MKSPFYGPTYTICKGGHIVLSTETSERTESCHESGKVVGPKNETCMEQRTNSGDTDFWYFINFELRIKNKPLKCMKKVFF